MGKPWQITFSVMLFAVSLYLFSNKVINQYSRDVGKKKIKYAKQINLGIACSTINELVQSIRDTQDMFSGVKVHPIGFNCFLISSDHN